MENNSSTTLVVELSAIQQALDLAVINSVSRCTEGILKKKQAILEWVSEKEALELLNLRDRKHLKKISIACNIPTSKPGRTVFYSIKGLNAYLENSSTISIDL